MVEQKKLGLRTKPTSGLGDFYFLSGREPEKGPPNLTFGEKFSLQLRKTWTLRLCVLYFTIILIVLFSWCRTHCILTTLRLACEVLRSCCQNLKVIHTRCVNNQYVFGHSTVSHTHKTQQQYIIYQGTISTFFRAIIVPYSFRNYQ